MNTQDRDLESNARATSRLRDLVSRLDESALSRSLGGGWTVAFALVHLAFWDVRQHVALHRYMRGDEFPAEDVTTNATLEAIAPLFDAGEAGAIAVQAAEQLDATLEALTGDQLESLRQTGFAYAIERWRHREDHVAQIEAVLP
ncbi:MAG: DinB family protein [Chloroflexi bacterium]|nr:DinB family protein [Chloroflexota bacterium]